MSFDDPNSPYRTPESVGTPPSQGFNPPGDATKRPGPLTAVAVITLIFGILGSIGGCCGVGVAIFSDAVSGMMTDVMDQAAQNAQGDEAEAQMEAMRALMDSQSDWLIISAVGSGVGLLVSLIMVVGGIMALRNSPSSKMVLLTALIACIPSRILTSVVQLLAGMAGNEVQKQVYEEAGLPNLVQQVEMSAMLGYAGNLVTSVVFIIGYAFMIGYLMRSTKAKAYFDALDPNKM